VPLQALQAAQTVLQHAGHVRLQAEALTILARAHHALGKMQEAFQYYQQVWLQQPCQRPIFSALFELFAWFLLVGGACSRLVDGWPQRQQTPVASRGCSRSHGPSVMLVQAAQLDPKLALPKLGLAQMNVLMGQPGNAVSILESVLLDVPQWIDALEVGAPQPLPCYACHGQSPWLQLCMLSMCWQ